jgi:DNA-binding CsgD family transcriptional regulator
MLDREGLRRASVRLGGLSSEQDANRLGIKPETARSHLKAVFAKTETHRPSELAILLAKL